MCGAWSFDTVEEVCYIHTVDSCCGQFGKRVQDSEWISGYACHRCWSTLEGTECPCPVEERNVLPVISTAFNSGGRSPFHETSSVSKLNTEMIQSKKSKLGVLGSHKTLKQLILGLGQMQKRLKRRICSHYLLLTSSRFQV